MQKLKDKQIWLLWRRKERNGKVSKEPFSAKGGPTGTSSEYSDTWVTYEEARSTAKRYQSAGIGFIIPDGIIQELLKSQIVDLTQIKFHGKNLVGD